MIFFWGWVGRLLVSIHEYSVNLCTWFFQIYVLNFEKVIVIKFYMIFTCMYIQPAFYLTNKCLGMFWFHHFFKEGYYIVIMADLLLNHEWKYKCYQCLSIPFRFDCLVVYWLQICILRVPSPAVVFIFFPRLLLSKAAFFFTKKK